MLVKKIFGQKNVWSKKICGPKKNFMSEKTLVLKIFGSEQKFLSKHFGSAKYFGSEQILGLKKNSCDIGHSDP